MCTQMNIDEKPFTNIQEMLEYNNKSKGNPSKSLFHGVECNPKTMPLKQYFCALTDSHEDKYKYVYGRFSIGINTAASAETVIGRLWVSYDIDLSKPLLSEMQEVRGTMSAIQVSNSAASVYAWGLKANAPASRYIIGSDQLIVLDPYEGPVGGYADVNFLRFTTPGRYAVRAQVLMDTSDPYWMKVGVANYKVVLSDSGGSATEFSIIPGVGTDCVRILSYPWTADITAAATNAATNGVRDLSFIVEIVDVNCPEGHVSFRLLDAIPSSFPHTITCIGLNDSMVCGVPQNMFPSDLPAYDPQIFSLVSGKAQQMTMNQQYRFCNQLKAKARSNKDADLLEKFEALKRRVEILDFHEQKDRDHDFSCELDEARYRESILMNTLKTMSPMLTDSQRNVINQTLGLVPTTSPVGQVSQGLSSWLPLSLGGNTTIAKS